MRFRTNCTTLYHHGSEKVVHIKIRRDNGYRYSVPPVPPVPPFLYILTREKITFPPKWKHTIFSYKGLYFWVERVERWYKGPQTVEISSFFLYHPTLMPMVRGGTCRR